MIRPVGRGVPVLPPVIALKVLANWYALCGVPLHESESVPLVAQALSRPSAQKASSWMPLVRAKLVSVVALAVLNTSLVLSFTPIIGVLPSIAHSCCEVLVGQIWPSWVCRAVAASVAALPMSRLGP